LLFLCSVEYAILTKCVSLTNKYIIYPENTFRVTYVF